MTGVREWAQVAADAERKGEVVHVGRIFEICVEKGSELPKGDPGRKFKGRTVFQGNEVRDQDWDYAKFADEGSAPASLAAAKAADAYGLLPGNTVMQADATQAYTQASMTGVPTWVRTEPP